MISSFNTDIVSLLKSISCYTLYIYNKANRNQSTVYLLMTQETSHEFIIAREDKMKLTGQIKQ